jgi:hypothetical protein
MPMLTPPAWTGVQAKAKTANNAQTKNKFFVFMANLLKMQSCPPSSWNGRSKDWILPIIREEANSVSMS